MKVWSLKSFKDISNNYEGIDDYHVFICDNKEKANVAFKSKMNDILDYFMVNYEQGKDELNIEEREDFFHANNDRDYITCKIEEMEVH